MKSPEYLDHLRHSAAHLLAAAVMELWPDTKRTIGPAIENGFYFDFEFSEPISENDLPLIEKTMRRLVKGWNSFERHELSLDQAKAEYPDNPYKQELIEEFANKSQKLTFYKSGDYWDLCRGGHLDNPARDLKHFKLLSLAGAYWRGDEKNNMLTRIYGTAFPSQEELDQHLLMLEEAKKRDHRKLGKELGLYFIDEVVGKGLVMWLPNGTVIRDEIEKLAKEKEAEAGYQRVVTPHIAKEELFVTSGHLPYYQDSMFPGMKMDDGTYYLKAMNCPHHHRIYLHQPRSYRDLPLRLAEYGTCYRNELSGTLAGLLRVRGMAMNDAHIYCAKDQIEKEIKSVIQLTQDYFKLFGLSDYWFRLSKWDPQHTEKYINEPENWEFTQSVIRQVLSAMSVPFEEADDEAAFYGPKIDVQFRSAIGREETMSTIQLDFVAKSRFNLSYADKNGEANQEVFVIHRAPLSVHERFMAFLIEHYAGAFPVWLAPIQAVALPIGESQLTYASKLTETLKDEGIRIENWHEGGSLGKRIRLAEKQKIPYMLIIGDKEVETNSVSVRVRGQQDLGTVPLSQFSRTLLEKISTKSTNL